MLVGSDQVAGAGAGVVAAGSQAAVVGHSRVARGRALAGGQHEQWVHWHTAHCQGIEGRSRHRPRAHRTQLLTVAVPGVGDQLAGQRGHHRQHEDRLRHHHGRRREQDAQRAQRTGTRQQQVDPEADHHRGQRQQRIEQRDNRAVAREARHREPGADDHAEDGGHRAGRAADAQ